MKNKKMIVRFSLVLLLIVMIFSIVLKANNNKTKISNAGLSFIQPDTLKPDIIQEKRITKIEIINGKKKIVEKIIKMKGDSIVEEKTINREEDADETPGFNHSPKVQSFGFSQEDFFNMDSLLAMQFKQFNTPFLDDSTFQDFGFNINPGFNMGFGDSFMDDDFFKRFNDIFQNPMSPDIEKLFKNKGHNFPFTPPKQKFQHKSERNFKTLKEIVRDQLINDGFIKDFNDSYKFKINEKNLKINGNKQPENIYDRYKKLIEDNSGLDLDGEFEYRFKNSKSLKSGVRML